VEDERDIQTCGGKSRVFQGIDVGQKPILKKTNTSFGPPWSWYVC
jgi:hypothetical protein